MTNTNEATATATATYSLSWISADGQGSYDMGTYATEADAEAAIDGARKELLGQCGSDAERDGIEAGRFAVEGC